MLKRNLRLEIIGALAFKALAILLLYLAFFSGAHSTRVTAEQMAAALTRGDVSAK